MPLTPTNYDPDYGEWYPWNGSNYTGSYPTAIKLFNSLSAQEIIGSNISIETKVNTSLSSTESYAEAEIGIWPDDISGNQTAYSNGGTIYRYNIRPGGDIGGDILIDIMEPLTDNPADDLLFDQYKASVQRLFDKSLTSYLDFGVIEDKDGNIVPCGDNSRYEIETSFDGDDAGEGPIEISGGNRYRVNIGGDGSPFDVYEGPSIRFYTGNFVEYGRIEWLAYEKQYVESDDDQVADWLVSGIGQLGQEGQYIKLESTDNNAANNGRIFKVGSYVDVGGIGHTEVISIDGNPLNNENGPKSYTIKNISMRPKLKIKYRIPAVESEGQYRSSTLNNDTPSSGVYTFYSAPNTENPWGFVSFSKDGVNKTDPGNWITDPTEDPNNHLLMSSNFDNTALIQGLGGIRQSNWGSWTTSSGLDGPSTTGFNAIQLNTNFSSQNNKTRITPWRKAYRFLNRFTFNGADLSLYWDDPSIMSGTLEGRAYFEMKYDHVSGSLPAGERGIQYPDACIHRPPCFYASDVDNQGDLGDNHITLGHSITKSNNLGSRWWSIGDDYDLDGNLDPSWNRWNANYYTHPEGSGYQLIEKNNPNAMSFTLNLQDAGSRTGLPNYDFTGSVSCTDIVIPAYSGETLYRDFNNSHQGFMVNDYQSTSGNVVNAIFIDISQTDEVLRMSGQGGYTKQKAAEMWSETFSKIRVRNVTKNQTTEFGLGTNPVNYEIVTKNSSDSDLDPKTNFVLAIVSDESTDWLSDWQQGDKIEISMINKQVLEDYLNPNLDMDTANYVNISYRELEDEHKDDIEFQFSNIAGQLNNFSITGDGEVDGNITIVYDGDVPSNVRFEIVEHEEGQED